MIFNHCAVTYMLPGEPGADARFREEFARIHAEDALALRNCHHSEAELIVARNIAAAGNFIRFA